MRFVGPDLFGLGQVRTLQHLLQQLGLTAADDVACIMLQGWASTSAATTRRPSSGWTGSRTCGRCGLDPMLAMPLRINVALGRGDVATALDRSARPAPPVTCSPDPPNWPPRSALRTRGPGWPPRRTRRWNRHRPGHRRRRLTAHTMSLVPTP